MLRLCLGEFNGRRLQLPPQSITRPVSQKVRHSVFNILGHRYDIDWPSVHVLDVFAGSGAMGLEALSLGAEYLTFFEKDDTVLKCLYENIYSLNVKDRAHVVRTNLLRRILVKPKQAGVAKVCFIDPPYKIFDKVSDVAGYLQAAGWINSETLLCLESQEGDELPDTKFTVDDIRTFGQTKLHFAYMR